MQRAFAFVLAVMLALTACSTNAARPQKAVQSERPQLATVWISQAVPSYYPYSKEVIPYLGYQGYAYKHGVGSKIIDDSKLIYLGDYDGSKVYTDKVYTENPPPRLWATNTSDLTRKSFVSYIKADKVGNKRQKAMSATASKNGLQLRLELPKITYSTDAQYFAKAYLTNRTGKDIVLMADNLIGMRVTDAAGKELWGPENYLGGKIGATFIARGATHAVSPAFWVKEPGTYEVVCQTNIVGGRIEQADKIRREDTAYKPPRLETPPLIITVK